MPEMPRQRAWDKGGINMNSKNVVIGNYYRLYTTPNYGWAKVLVILPPRTYLKNVNYWVAKCEWTVDKDDSFGFIKYFRLSDLING